MPPAARVVCASVLGRLPTTRTSTPRSASSMAARRPEPPVPMTRTDAAICCSEAAITARTDCSRTLIPAPRTNPVVPTDYGLPRVRSQEAPRQTECMDVYEAVATRRAVRAFTDQPVSRQVLERVLTAAGN